MQSENSVRFGIRASLITLFICAIILAGGILAVFNFFEQRRTVIAYTRGALEMMVATGAPRFKGEDVLRLSRRGDFRTPAYARTYKVLKRIYIDNHPRNLTEKSLYIIKPKPGSSGKGDSFIHAAYLPGDAKRPYRLGTIESMENPKVNYIGDTYDSPPEIRKQISKLLEGKMVANSTGVYTTPKGEWISAFAPILDKAGKAVGVLQADYRFEDVNMQILVKFALQLVMIALATLIAIIAIVFVSRRITRPIHAIAAAADQLAQGDFHTRVDVKSSDEIGVLGRHFNSMAKVLEEKTRLTRYVSQETMRQVEAGAAGIGSHHSERAEVCCLFSDIRGFTRYTADSPAEWVVSILNEILKCQTSIILRNGGSVDKFVGDEVMAVFEGEDMLERAVKSAREIQSELESVRNRENLDVGIGIRMGEVIRGDIGAEQRTDYTIIGTTVNMAARLCSGAKAGQILITRDDHDRLRGDLTGKYIGRARFKGIAEPVQVFDLSQADPSRETDISKSA